MFDLEIFYWKMKRKFEVMFEKDLPVDQIKSIDQFMRSITGDKRWRFDACFGSGSFSTIDLPADDPAAYATLYAISKLNDAQKKQEEFNKWDGAYSGRSRISISNSDGYMEAVAWLTPLSERFNSNEINPGLRDLPIYEGSEIRVIGDVNFMKRHHKELCSKYKSAFAMASENRLSARDLFRNTPTHHEPPIKILL
jgi:hypothetical protein